MATDGNYAFVEFRSKEESVKGFELSKIQILGYPLRVGRPRVGNNHNTV